MKTIIDIDKFTEVGDNTATQRVGEHILTVVNISEFMPAYDSWKLQHTADIVHRMGMSDVKGVFLTDNGLDNCSVQRGTDDADFHEFLGVSMYQKAFELIWNDWQPYIYDDDVKRDKEARQKLRDIAESEVGVELNPIDASRFSNEQLSRMMNLLKAFVPYESGAFTTGHYLVTEYIRFYDLKTFGQRLGTVALSNDQMRECMATTHYDELMAEIREHNRRANEVACESVWSLECTLAAHDLWIKRFGECGWAQRWADARYNKATVRTCLGTLDIEQVVVELMKEVKPTPFWRALRTFTLASWRAFTDTWLKKPCECVKNTITGIGR